MTRTQGGAEQRSDGASQRELSGLPTAPLLVGVEGVPATPLKPTAVKRQCHQVPGVADEASRAHPNPLGPWSPMGASCCHLQAIHPRPPVSLHTRRSGACAWEGGPRSLPSLSATC